eukprot:7712185-Alexandrium_andersonii.AAC.1
MCIRDRPKGGRPMPLEVEESWKSAWAPSPGASRRLGQQRLGAMLPSWWRQNMWVHPALRHLPPCPALLLHPQSRVLRGRMARLAQGTTCPWHP